MVLENKEALIGDPIGELLIYAHDRRKDAKVFVNRALATTVSAGPHTYVIEGGERIWMKKDSTTTFYVTLENASVQLTFERRLQGGFTIRRQVIGSTHRSPGHGSSVDHAWNRSEPTRRTPSS